MTGKRRDIGERLIDGTKKHPVIVPLLVVLLFLETVFFFGSFGRFLWHFVSAIGDTAQHFMPTHGAGGKAQ